MQNFSHRPGFYKTVPCRYFDFQTGRELEPRCPNGNHCGYIHPNDPQWANRRPAMSKLQQQISHKLYDAPRNRSPPHLPPPRASSVGPPDYRSRFRAPTPPPREREREIKPDPDARRGRSVERMQFDDLRRERYDRPAPPIAEPRELSRAAPYGGYPEHAREPQDRHAHSKERFPETNPVRSRAMVENTSASSMIRSPVIVPSSFERRDPAQDSVNGSAHTGSANQNKPLQLPVPTLFNSSSVNITEKVIESFKAIADMTNKVVLDTAAYDKEDGRLETYNSLASTLAKISPAAVQALTPSLELVTAARKQQRDKVQQNYARLTHAWEDVFALFVAGATKAIDAAADAASERLRKEADAQIERTRAESEAQLKKFIRAAQHERDLATSALRRNLHREDSSSQKRKHEEERRWEERTERNGSNKERDQGLSGFREPDGKRPRYSEHDISSLAEQARTHLLSQQPGTSSNAGRNGGGTPPPTSNVFSTASTPHSVRQSDRDEIPGMTVKPASQQGSFMMSIDSQNQNQAPVEAQA